MNFYRPGDQVNFTYMRTTPNRTELVLRLEVVEDSQEFTMAFITAGTPIIATRLANGEPFPRDVPYHETARLERSLRDSEWLHTNVLFIWKPEWNWDVRLYWDAVSREFRGWYVNIQANVNRVEHGFESTDHFLDIVVAPNGTWEFKDENELEDATRLGMYTREERTQIRMWADQALEMITNWEWPFNLEPQTLQPDPTWHFPGSPADQG